jgi:general secretion pathway protein D
MAIYQETSNIQPTAGTASDIITNKRSIETNVLVDDGQIIVLGGLIEDRVNDGMEKVPGLGDLPFVGGLFRYQTRRNNKTNLMVFLRPTVVRTAEQSINVVNDRYDFIRGVQSVAQPAKTLVLPDMSAPLLPALHDGRPTAGPLLNAQPRANVIEQPGAPVLMPAPAAPTPPSSAPEPYRQ